MLAHASSRPALGHACKAHNSLRIIERMAAKIGQPCA